MRMPTRLHITWQDDNTLRIDTDAGTQTRLFHFHGSKAETGDPEWQGTSTAQWEFVRTKIPPHVPGPIHGGSLKVVTTHMRAGYLRKNGVPYSANAVLTEYFDVTTEPNGWQSILLTTIIEDPTVPDPVDLAQYQFPQAPRWLQVGIRRLVPRVERGYLFSKCGRSRLFSVQTNSSKSVSASKFMPSVTVQGLV